MINHTLTVSRRALVIGIAILLLPSLALPQTKVKPGFNLFTIEQDVEMGREASKEIEKQVPVLEDPIVERYISDLGLKLARKSQMPELPWQFKVVNAADVNAFALPGGFIYVNRGLIETAETEGQLAGVLGHEISHVTLRHGTNQLTKALPAQLLLGLFSRGSSGGWRAAVTELGLGVVVNSIFLKFSRQAETQADIVGTQVLHAASYDPHQMAGMFEILQKLQGRDPSKIEQFFSSHPAPANRIERIEEEIKKLRPLRNPQTTSRRFQQIQARLKQMPPPPKARPGATDTGSATRPEPPARALQRYRHPEGIYELSYPSNWKPYEGGTAGVRSLHNQSHIVYGAMVNLTEPRLSGRSGRRSLEEATGQLIQEIQRQNPYLKQVGPFPPRTRLDGAEALRVRLEGSPPGQAYVENVTLVTRWVGDRLFSMVFVAPRDDFDQYRSAFTNMMSTLRVLNR